MNLIKIHSCICLLIITVLTLALSTSLCTSAVRYEGGTEVVAHIDSPPQTQPTTTSETSPAPQGNSNVLTGKEISVLTVAAAITLFASAVIIYICIKHRKNE